MLSLRRCVRWISSTRPSWGAQTTVSSLLGTSSTVPTVDHLMPIERAAELMAESHVEALPVTKDAKVVGLFTEHDYFKVLNQHHEATVGSPVAEAATMGEDLVVAYPEDTVANCLHVMTQKNLMALPVIERDGLVVGTVSMADLTREYLTDQRQNQSDHVFFSEPSHFPENPTLPTGAVHDELHNGDKYDHKTMERMQALYEQLKEDLHQAEEELKATIQAQQKLMLDPSFEERAAASFSEASAFPELLPAEDQALLHVSTATLSKMNGKKPTKMVMDTATLELLSEMDRFCEPSDFPDGSPVDEILEARKR